jgi:voltage-gated potassium channel
VTQAVRETLRRVLRRRHTALLVAIVVAFAVRPLVGDVGIGPMLFSLALLSLLLIALVTIQVDDLAGERAVLLAQRRRRTWIAWVLVVPAVVERLYVLLAPTPQTYLIASISWLLFISFVTWHLLRTLLRQKTVTGETISMSISIYLLIGLTWAILYVVIFQFDPHAFDLGASSSLAGASVGTGEAPIFATLMYLSLTTISSVGFGDITPLTLQARFAAVAEGITGQFYLAVLVARLVSMHMSGAASTKEP